ncbi:MAG: cation-translocating P-type ATPase [Gammaproteobacteria bacterium]|nr:cation-translocating P-type ATPase [Gammaproteobacteria bacterium]MBU1733159.1 cation-translocating P-type ATPase [Gammaproteobacteria bacterium]MBU1892207.1 cation-translocating P-type ATPase [Gammaproteobacteria bacterium]
MPDTEQQPFWLVSGEEALSRLDASLQGLTETEARQRLERFGPNRLREKPPRPAWMKFLDQFKDLLVIVLFGAAILAGAIGDLKDAVVILVVIVFNACLGFYQEFRAEATLAALKKMLAQRARVRRGGEVLEIAAETLVPGDIVLLEAGDRIPADGRVLAAHNAEVAEAALTGESHAVGKLAEALAPEEYPLAERCNMVFMNTVVTRGRIEALVSATSMETEMGRITGLLEAAEESLTPLQNQLDGLGKRLAIIAGVVVTLIFMLGILRGDPLVQTIMTSIALAVAAIPEGLPAVVTVTLAIGMHRMAKNRAIVKKLSAVETLGSTSVICSDKTGTLTLNQMTARQLFYRGRRFMVSGEGYAGIGEITAEVHFPLPLKGEEQYFLPLLAPAALCNESRIRDGELIGDPTEGALLALALKGGIDPDNLAERRPRIAEIPFDSEHKFMATFHHDGEWVRMLVKGAPDVIMARAERHLDANGEERMGAEIRTAFESENARLASEAMRVLAVASRDIPANDFDPGGDLMAWAEELTLIGLVGIIDPPRPEARDAIRLCKMAGIQVKMITGDHAITATAIARELGLEGAVLSGAELDSIDVAELSRHVEETAVFARVAPEHKVKIVQALKARGHVVAMTGDGVNDAPALKNADIGVAMGITGTEVTKEAATMVLTDDNFATIVGAVKEGRTIYDNIVKFVRFQLSTNVGAIFTVLGAQLLSLPTPFTAIQILWINIIMDGPPAMTLGLEPARPGIMEESPRRAEARILTLPRFWRLLAYGTIMAAGTVGVFAYGLSSGGIEHALTLAFTTFVLFQFFNVFNARNETGTAFNRQFFANGKLWMALLGVVGLQVVVVHWSPAQEIFSTTDLSLADWGLAAMVASSVLLLEETYKSGARLLFQRQEVAGRNDR